MQKTLTLLFLLASGLASGQSFKDFKWMTGTWGRQNTKLGSSAFESWEKMTKKGFSGQGITLQGADTVFVEKLSIVKKENKLYYVAEVSQNVAPTYFKITSYSKNGFVCENPDHDFPKKIEYKLQGNILTATISGEGKEIPFQFRRMD